MTQERRQNRRIQLSNPVRIFTDEDEDEDYALPGRLRDISLGGLFIFANDQVPIGDTCRLEVVLYEPGDPINVWLEATVVRHEKGGFAVQITGFFQESFARLRDLLLHGGVDAEASLDLAPSS
jgi:c-di-GMP-binding flagellar brake protein YcgR